MTDDISRQAELRQLRRPRSRQGEEILPLDPSKMKVCLNIPCYFTNIPNFRSPYTYIN